MVRVACRRYRSGDLSRLPPEDSTVAATELMASATRCRTRSALVSWVRRAWAVATVSSMTSRDPTCALGEFFAMLARDVGFVSAVDEEPAVVNLTGTGGADPSAQQKTGSKILKCHPQDHCLEWDLIKCYRLHDI